MEELLNMARKNTFFNSILTLLKKVGLDMFAIRIMYWWFEKHPTNSMKKSADYFGSHVKEIDYVGNLLSDEKSKRIWKLLIQFRQTMNYRLHPGMETDQYFPKDIMHLGDNEVFIDCGGYDGMTMVEFIRRVHGVFRGGVIFEPDAKCLPMIRKNVPLNERITVIPKGVWNEKTELEFVASGDSASHIIEECNQTKESVNVIPVIPIDECEECNNATFIKMDLEGAEMKALQGAQQTIRNNKPKLAICIYHSDEDMLEIIDFIHNLVPEYKLYVRHHSTGIIETVLYAVL